ncbi:retrovirus-related Pol polyprotein from transposon 297 [Trichonephila clavipes]|nr:retrovirus-related Pol polyprotein from transposon 297 [Trichonephila clavipes]
MLKLGIIEVGEPDYMSPMILVEVAGKEPRPCQGFRTPSEVKVQAVLEFPTPRTKAQIRAFLNLAGYYQKYINLFSVIAAPLTDALKGRAKKGEFTWTTEYENAFGELKGKLTDKPILYAPNFEREFILLKRTLQTQVEKRYCTTEKECASIVFAIKRLHYYLDGNSFLVMIDHNPLVWLNRNVSSNPRLMRWALALQPYNFRIVHRSAVEIFGGPDTHTCILQLQRNPFLTPEESNPVDRKMRGRDAFNLHGSGGQRILLSQNIGL